ncbi:MAG: ATP-dependent Clp protease adaptor ClpS [Chitinophagaceae bacterium]|nr:ATP-dependent Clp protease adaptor ClpS [Chitinophagaceae bacterium]
MKTFELTETELLPDLDVLEDDNAGFHLIVWNDEVNTFDWVIETLISVCKHTQEQAEQCTMLIHYKGKCSVKTGDYDGLKVMCDGITDRGIGASIEELVS